MDTNDLNQPITIRDPDIDTAALMRRLDERIRERRSQAEARGIDFDALAEGRSPSTAQAGFDPQLQEDLRHLALSYNKITVDLSLIDKRQPSVSGLLQRLRASLHQVILYYVNMMAGRQIVVNGYVLDALSRVMQGMEEGRASTEVTALREQVAVLEARIQQLEEAWAKSQKA